MASGSDKSAAKQKLDFVGLETTDIQRMISYLNDHTEYRVVTEAEYDRFQFSTPKPSVKSEHVPPRPPPPTPIRKYSLIPTDQNGNNSSGNWQRPRIPTFSGDQKGEATFEVWKYEVRCILREGNFDETIIVQSLRSSLKGQARNLLLTLSEDVTPEQILDKLEGVYGNVYSSEALLQKFYTEKQQPNQTVADYGMKLESLLQSAIERGHVNPESKDDMLRSKFWSGLRDPLLRNATRHKYDCISSFDTLMREVRAIELELTNSSPNDTVTVSNSVQQSSVSVELQKITEVLKKLDTFGKRMDSMESELKGLKSEKTSNQSNRGYYRGNGKGRGWNRNRGRGDSRGRGGDSHDKDLNG